MRRIYQCTASSFAVSSLNLAALTGISASTQEEVAHLCRPIFYIDECFIANSELLLEQELIAGVQLVHVDIEMQHCAIDFLISEYEKIARMCIMRAISTIKAKFLNQCFIIVNILLRGTVCLRSFKYGIEKQIILYWCRFQYYNSLITSFYVTSKYLCAQRIQCYCA